MNRVSTFFTSLRVRLILASIVVEILMLALLVINTNRLTHDSLAENTRIRLTEVETLLNASLAGNLMSRDFAALQEILDGIRSQEGIRYLILFNNKNIPVAMNGWRPGDALPRVDESGLMDSDGDGVHDVVIPVKLENQTYGMLRFGVSTEFMEKARSRLLRQSLVIGGVAVAVTTFLLTLLGLFLTRPLARLTEASAAVAMGNFEVSVPSSGDDEVARLAAAFNLMAGAVRSRVEALQQSEAQKTAYLNESRQEHARLSALLSAMSEGILFVSAEDRVLYYNPAFVQMWLVSESDNLVGRHMKEAFANAPSLLARPDQYARHLTELCAAREVSDSFEIVMTDGRTVNQFSFPVHDTEGRHVGRLWMYEDITHERQTAEQLIYLAERDSLTGLFNRHRFQEELERMMSDVGRRRSMGALLFFDLDEFKAINDSLGHRVGDAVLIRVAGEIGTLVRRNEVLSRLGGDEFGLLVSDVTETEVALLAERVVRAIAQIPFSVAGHNLRLTTSVGVALYPQHATTVEDLVAHADSAMYQAKEAGKNTWRLYRPELDDSRESVTRLSWNDRISQALEKNLLHLHFQGVYRTQDLVLSHLEALVRMEDLENPGQWIMPAHFIGVAEKTGKILDIDRWVVQKAIATLALSADTPPIAVNISGRSFDDPMLPQFIGQMLRQYKVEPHRLLVELTETSAVSDIHDARRFIESLRQMGCRICLDDFGTGFSSFAYLKHLDADILKIDGLFIRDLTNDMDNQTFVRAITEVSHGMRKICVAEFVENAEILALLRGFGVDYVQGYHLDRPQEDHPALRRA